MSMKDKYDVYGVGAALVDRELNVTDEDLFQMNLEKSLMILIDKQREKQLMDYFKNKLLNSERKCGGSTGNAIMAIAQFGGKTFYSCKVANDDNGLFYFQDLHRAGVDCDIENKSSDDHTGTCLVMITPDAERTLCTYLGINAYLSQNDIHSQMISQSKYVYFECYMLMSSLSFAAAIHLCHIAKQNNVKIALSLSDSSVVNDFRDGLSKILNNDIDLIFCNRSEALSWAQTNDIDIAVDSLKRIVRTFAITLGKDGALIYDGTQLHSISPHQVNPIDTTGAGDMFAGAFLYAITHGKDFVMAGNFANYAAANLVANKGARLTRSKQNEILLHWNKSSQTPFT